jgi:hypothetical protein
MPITIQDKKSFQSLTERLFNEKSLGELQNEFAGYFGYQDSAELKLSLDNESDPENLRDFFIRHISNDLYLIESLSGKLQWTFSLSVISNHNLGIEVVDVEDKVSDLRLWIGEAQSAGRHSDVVLMEEDLDTLKATSDDYVLGNTCTNGFYIPENGKLYNEAVNTLINEHDEAMEAFRNALSPIKPELSELINSDELDEDILCQIKERVVQHFGDDAIASGVVETLRQVEPGLAELEWFCEISGIEQLVDF